MVKIEKGLVIFILSTFILGCVALYSPFSIIQAEQHSLRPMSMVCSDIKNNMLKLIGTIPIIPNISEGAYKGDFVKRKNPGIFVDFDLEQKWDIKTATKDDRFVISATVEFYKGSELVARNNVDINKEMAVTYLCGDNFGVLEPHRGQGIGKEMVAWTFLRARQIADSFGMQLKWAVAYYVWGMSDLQREDYNPEEWSEAVVLADVTGLFKSLKFNTQLTGKSLGDFKDIHPVFDGYWARGLKDFCAECENILVHKYSSQDTTSTFVKGIDEKGFNQIGVQQKILQGIKMAA